MNEQTQTNTNQEQQNQEQGFWKKHGKTIGIGAGILAAVAAVGAGAWYFLGKSDSGDAVATEDTSVADAQI